MTLAELKRRLVVGNKLVMPWHRFNGPYIGQVGAVARKQANAITIKRDDGREGWLYFDRADNYLFHKNGFVVLEDNEPLICYDFA